MNTSLFIAAWGISALAQQPQTPFEMAMVLERELADGVGILVPDPDTPYTCYYGVLPFPQTSPAGFPQGFLDGLVSTQRFGVAVYPVTLRADDGTGATVFHNAGNEPFWEETPGGTYRQDWIQRLHGAASPQMAELLKPSHVEAQWVFVAEQDIPAYHAGWLAHLPPPAPPPAPADVPVLNVTAFAPAADAFRFASAWNTTAFFPASLMDVWFTQDLSAPDWSVVKTVPVSNAGPRAAFFEVPRAALPPWAPPDAHGPGCAPVTNIVVSPLDAAVSYTNAVCGCALPARKPSGFFRLGIRETGSGTPPAWWRVLYGFAPYDSWEDGADFSGDGNANRDKYGLGISPVAPPNAASSAAIQYNYDGDDRLNASFIGAQGAAAVTRLTPAGNPNVQQERSAP